MNNLRSSILLVFALSVVSAWGCKKSAEISEEPKKPAEATQQVVADTSVAQPEEMTPQETTEGLTELEKDKTEIVSRLEALVSLIERKENSLLAREQNLHEREQRLVAESALLSERERSVRRLQTVSWVVLGVGLVGIVVGLVISRRPRKRAPEQIAKIEQDTKKAKEMAKELKDAYIKKMEPQLKEWEARIAELRSIAAKAKEDVKEDYNKQIDALAKELKAAQQKLQEVKDAGEDAWEGLKSGVEKAWGEMKKAVDNAVDKIR